MAKKYTNNESHGNKKKKTITKAKNKGHKNYSEADLLIALNEVGQGKTLRELLTEFKIPKSTLFNKSKNFSQIGCKKSPPTILSTQEEKDIVQWLQFRALRDFPITKNMM